MHVTKDLTLFFVKAVAEKYDCPKLAAALDEQRLTDALLKSYCKERWWVFRMKKAATD